VENKNLQDERCKQRHMCRLKQEGMMEEIDRHSARPRVICSKCGAKADDAAYLCNPRPL
jgi:hypothetical protein